mmetsp:Transcript_19548/g.75051  ORF Transcript_19548/g.75051 Transcript_19548/m.75051 type:complete len:200 (+) Transcript_19548:1044-1643(+)
MASRTSICPPTGLPTSPVWRSLQHGTKRSWRTPAPSPTACSQTPIRQRCGCSTTMDLLSYGPSTTWKWRLSRLRERMWSWAASAWTGESERLPASRAAAQTPCGGWCFVLACLQSSWRAALRRTLSRSSSTSGTLATLSAAMCRASISAARLARGHHRLPRTAASSCSRLLSSRSSASLYSFRSSLAQRERKLPSTKTL